MSYGNFLPGSAHRCQSCFVEMNMSKARERFFRAFVFSKSDQMQRIISFSGGKSSALMTILEYNPETDHVVFCDTGREHPGTYKFILDLEAHEGIPIHKIGGKNSEDVKELGSVDYFAAYLEARNWTELPTLYFRSCTKNLKIKVSRRWARRHIGTKYTTLIGFRSDEQHRILTNKSRWQGVTNEFPLATRGISKADVDEYWKSKPYTLGIPPILGNCVGCFMKGKERLISMFKHYPELAEHLIEDERKTALRNGRTYFNNIRIEQLLAISQQPDLFAAIPLEDLSPAYNCHCGI